MQRQTRSHLRGRLIRRAGIRRWPGASSWNPRRRPSQMEPLLMMGLIGKLMYGEAAYPDADLPPVRAPLGAAPDGCANLPEVQERPEGRPTPDEPRVAQRQQSGPSTCSNTATLLTGQLGVSERPRLPPILPAAPLGEVGAPARRRHRHLARGWRL